MKNKLYFWGSLICIALSGHIIYLMFFNEPEIVLLGKETDFLFSVKSLEKEEALNNITTTKMDYRIIFFIKNINCTPCITEIIETYQMISKSELMPFINIQFIFEAINLREALKEANVFRSVPERMTYVKKGVLKNKKLKQALYLVKDNKCIYMKEFFGSIISSLKNKRILKYFPIINNCRE